MENPNDSQALMKFVLKLLLIFAVVAGVIIGVSLLIGMAMFNWDG
jgi:hypothetical protein